jgi:PhnB protein
MVTMPRVSTYLNFPRSTEQAFRFYRSVFGGDFNGPIHRFADMPATPGQPPMAEVDKTSSCTWNCRSSRAMC